MYAKITDFLNTPLVDRIINAKEFYREYQFTVNINLSEYDENIDNSLKELRKTIEENKAEPVTLTLKQEETE